MMRGTGFAAAAIIRWASPSWLPWGIVRASTFTLTARARHIEASVQQGSLSPLAEYTTIAMRMWLELSVVVLGAGFLLAALSSDVGCARRAWAWALSSTFLAWAPPRIAIAFSSGAADDEL